MENFEDKKSQKREMNENEVMMVLATMDEINKLKAGAEQSKSKGEEYDQLIDDIDRSSINSNIVKFWQGIKNINSIDEYNNFNKEFAAYKKEVLEGSSLKKSLLGILNYLSNKLIGISKKLKVE